MNRLLVAFKLYVAEIWRDAILAACMAVPLLMGAAFHFVLPPLEAYLCAQMETVQFLSPYFLLFDLLLALMTPMMFCFTGAMVLLSELDNGAGTYLMITPLGKIGYLFSRLGIPMLLSILYDIAILSLFTVSGLSLGTTLLLSLGGGLYGVLTAMLIVALAKNKMEGMAMAKLSGLLMLGLPLPFFLSTPLRYLCAFLPSFWLAEFAINNSALAYLLTIAVSFLWLWGLWGRFRRRIEP
ncbi:MAG: hypothetical protein PHI98_09090 [Eubacteriales bacterium]|nr:hypothetical protein [Eubacteriales bacterium]